MFVVVCMSMFRSSKCMLFDVALGLVLKFVLSRNCYIKSVVLFEADSVVLLPGCLESSGV